MIPEADGGSAGSEHNGTKLRKPSLLLPLLHLIASANASAIRITPGARCVSSSSTFLAVERVHDLGWRENWHRLLKQPLFDNGTLHMGSLPSMVR
jgi:hypothetical protein